MPTGAVYLRFDEGVTVTEVDAEAGYEIVSRLIGPDQPHSTLVDIRAIRGATRAARRKPPRPTLTRLAILVASPVSRMIANTYLVAVPPRVPTKLFTSEEKARTWLAASRKPVSAGATAD